MTKTPLSIAIVGAGLGGLTAASTLRIFGFDVQVYEQAARFARIGAGIQMMPNSMKVLRKIGVEDRVRATSFQPYSHLNRRALDRPRHGHRPRRADSQRAHRVSRGVPLGVDGRQDIGNSRTKWWGIDRHIVIYYTRRDKSEIYFVTSVPEPAEWLTKESWSAKGDVRELRAAYEGFHPDVRAVLEACPDCHKWAILEREPLPKWSEGRIVLLGDACHPMTPYMAQGAATAMEDAAVIARCLSDAEGDVRTAFTRHEENRKPRTSRIQAISSANTWMKGGNDDTSWLYGYDAWNDALAYA